MKSSMNWSGSSHSLTDMDCLGLQWSAGRTGTVHEDDLGTSREEEPTSVVASVQSSAWWAGAVREDELAPYLEGEITSVPASKSCTPSSGRALSVCQDQGQSAGMPQCLLPDSHGMRRRSPD